MDVNADTMNGPPDRTPEDLALEVERLRAVLIEQEKLALIGHLTAGILHEIRNPLNFIINFSKVSVSLLEDMNEILDRTGDQLNTDDKEELTEIGSDLSTNLDKIAQNGERAMRIIVSMLAQSRENNTCILEPTDLNQLVDDFTKLAYQGMRGNNRSFNMAIKTNFDPAIGKVEIDAHDLGRAILNIINNAAYAMDEKKRQQPDYSPVLTVTTSRTTTGFCISIKDNGTGIPGDIKDKIFKPFFTTKPGREGTGLGLSMTNDIIRKTHKGTLEINSADGEFTEFVINIPVHTTGD